jgi:hypothetical protein
MPWQQCNQMDERLKFITRLLDGEKMAARRQRLMTGNVVKIWVCVDGRYRWTNAAWAREATLRHHCGSFQLMS